MFNENKPFTQLQKLMSPSVKLQNWSSPTTISYLFLQGLKEADDVILSMIELDMDTFVQSIQLQNNVLQMNSAQTKKFIKLNKFNI